MPGGTTWPITRPSFQAAANQVRRGSAWRFSTRSGVGGHSAATQQTIKPRLTNRMRRLARAHPEAVAIVSPAAVEDSRTKYAAVVSPGKVSTMVIWRRWRLSTSPMIFTSTMMSIIVLFLYHGTFLSRVEPKTRQPPYPRTAYEYLRLN